MSGAIQKSAIALRQFGEALHTRPDKTSDDIDRYCANMVPDFDGMGAGSALTRYNFTEAIMPTTRGSHDLIASDRVEGTLVRSADGTRIGTIERVMIDKLAGTIAYAVLSVDDFVGLGRKHLPIPWRRLKYDTNLGAYRLEFIEAEFAGARDFDWGDRGHAIEIDDPHGVKPYWGIAEGW